MLIKISVVIIDKGSDGEEWHTDYSVIDIIDRTNRADYKSQDYMFLNFKKELSSYDELVEYFKNRKEKITFGNQNCTDNRQNLTNQIITFIQNNKTKLNTLWQPQQ